MNDICLVSNRLAESRKFDDRGVAPNKVGSQGREGYQILFEVAIIFGLLIANGIFAMAEIAVVSSKKGRLRMLADQGQLNAKVALDLAESPNLFLSTVQVGITLVGIFAGAFGGATLAAHLAEPIRGVERLAPYADKVAFGIAVGGDHVFLAGAGRIGCRCNGYQRRRDRW